MPRECWPIEPHRSCLPIAINPHTHPASESEIEYRVFPMMKTIIPHPPLPCCTPIITTSTTRSFIHFLPRYSRTLACSASSSRRHNLNGKDFDIDIIKEHQQHLLHDDDDDVIDIDYSTREGNKDIDIDQLQQVQQDEDGAGDVYSGGGSGRQEEKDFDRDPEFAEILGGYLDNPQKAQSKMEARLRRKRNKILHSKTGSGVPMKVSVKKFDFSNSYIWFEFYNAPLPKDISLICDTIRAWHIVGRLGGCNSMNMQLSQSPMDKRPSYDYIQGANVTPTTFYNIGDLEVQDNLARIWVDIGTSEPLLLDVLINALTQISSDVVGIKQVVFGGEEFENWKENLTSEDSGFSVHKI